MKNPAANTLLWMFSEASAPETWISKQAKRIYDAALRAENDGSWTKHAVGGSVHAVFPRADTIRGAKLAPYGMAEKEAQEYVESEIADLERKIARMKKELDVYGAFAFMQPREALAAPKHPFNAEEQILQILRRNPERLWVHGIEFRQDQSGAYVEV